MCQVNRCTTDEVCVYVDDLNQAMCVKLLTNQSKTQFDNVCSPYCLDTNQVCCSNNGKCSYNETSNFYFCNCNTSYSGINFKKYIYCTYSSYLRFK